MGKKIINNAFRALVLGLLGFTVMVIFQNCGNINIQRQEASSVVEPQGCKQVYSVFPSWDPLTKKVQFFLMEIASNTSTEFVGSVSWTIDGITQSSNRPIANLAETPNCSKKIIAIASFTNACFEKTQKGTDFLDPRCTTEPACPGPQPPNQTTNPICPTGQVGTITEVTRFTCSDSVWKPIVETTNSCTTPPVVSKLPELVEVPPLKNEYGLFCSFTATRKLLYNRAVAGNIAVRTPPGCLSANFKIYEISQGDDMKEPKAIIVPLTNGQGTLDLSTLGYEPGAILQLNTFGVGGNLTGSCDCGREQTTEAVPAGLNVVPRIQQVRGQINMIVKGPEVGEEPAPRISAPTCQDDLNVPLDFQVNRFDGNYPAGARVEDRTDYTVSTVFYNAADSLLREEQTYTRKSDGRRWFSTGPFERYAPDEIFFTVGSPAIANIIHKGKNVLPTGRALTVSIMPFIIGGGAHQVTVSPCRGDFSSKDAVVYPTLLDVFQENIELGIDYFTEYTAASPYTINHRIRITSDRNWYVNIRDMCGDFANLGRLHTCAPGESRGQGRVNLNFTSW